VASSARMLETQETGRSHEIAAMHVVWGKNENERQNGVRTHLTFLSCARRRSPGRRTWCGR
jgi:hypothetical protein